MAANLSAIGILIVVVVALLALFRGGRKEPQSPSDPSPAPTPESSPPIALPPFIVGSLDWRNQVAIDFRYRDHGCDAATGNPLLVSGATDPDGGELVHYIEVTGPDKTGAGERKYAVFGVTKASKGKTVRIDGKWVGFPWITNPGGRTENNAVAACVIGNEKDDPGYPVVVKCCDPNPVFSPELPTPLGQMTVRYKVRNTSGKTAEGLARATVTKGTC